MAATYPSAVKVFPTYYDYTDVIFASAVNSLHDEVVALENVLGVNPLVNTPYPTFSIGLQDLMANKAPVYHAHDHASLTHLDRDDHYQYMLCDGSRAFTGAVGGVPAAVDSQLVTLGQLSSFGYITVAQAEFLIGLALSNLVTGAWGGAPLVTVGAQPSAPAWRLTGGIARGVTNGNGDLWTDFAGAFGSRVQAFVATKLPTGGGGGRPPVPWIEAQLTLWSINVTGAWVRYSHDYGVQANMYATHSWMAIGT
jgi:hypothetical protein